MGDYCTGLPDWEHLVPAIVWSDLRATRDLVTSLNMSSRSSVVRAGQEWHSYSNIFLSSQVKMAAGLSR